MNQFVFTEDPGYNKLIICTDIHGHIDPFLRMLESVDFNENELTNQLIVLGDVVDRGPQSIELLQWFYTRRHNPLIMLLMGNHEQMVYGYFDGSMRLSDESLHRNGSYDSIQHLKRMPVSIRNDLVKYMKQLPLFYAVGHLLLSHAGCDFAEENMHDRFLWSRDFVTQPFHPEMFSIFGHTPTCYLNNNGSFDPWLDSTYNNKMCIDLGAAKLVQIGALVLTRTDSPLVFDVSIAKEPIKR